MHITKIELEDIKSHRRFLGEFQRGTTAITGENGAGKTTIIEAIAWTLFDLLDYKKDDFVRRGAKKGVARVAFESGLDEREYIVYRDTGTGYYVYDPQLRTRIADKKEEVSRFLWQHLGVEPGTDLEALFRRAIGVPQGTFTAIFLESPTERKKAFDKLLKVEEYRQGAEKLRETSRYIDQQVNDAKIRIGRAEGELARYDIEEESFRRYSAEVEELTASVDAATKESAEKAKIVLKLNETEKRVGELRGIFESAQNEKTKASFVVQQKQTEVAQARAATEKVAAVEERHKTHLAALEKLVALERERASRDLADRELRGIEKTLIESNAEKTRAAENLEKSTRAASEIETLRPLATQQEKLEAELRQLTERAGQFRAKEAEIKRLDDKILELRAKYLKNKEQIGDAEAKTAAAANFESLAKRDAEITREITRLGAKLDYDEQFQSEVKNGLCPILSQKCLNLKPGETLESFLKDQFVGLKSQITALETEHKSVADALKIAREAEKFTAALATLREREREIGDEGKAHKAERDSLVAALGDRDSLAAETSKVEASLKELGNPKAKIQLLETESARRESLTRQLAEIEAKVAKNDAARAELAAKLENFRDLDANWRAATAERDETLAAHREFVANENAARVLPEREKELASAQSELEKLIAAADKAENDLRAAETGYDRDLHAREKFALAELDRTLAEQRAHLGNAERLRKQAEDELARLAAIRKSMLAEFKEKERLEKVGEATDFIRDTLKKSAPLVAKNYIHYVALEANQMFRDITGNAERTLKWTEDYGVMLEEDGYDRPFVSMSGGEQMAAALSIRLALLKQLSDIRIAFFDEPTTNMDEVRRERLAEQISRITQKQTFDQLFVISHDDTFENYVDHVISVGGEEFSSTDEN